jgi:CRISPR-associated protein Cas1
MLKRILYFNNPYHLSVKHAQLQISDKDSGEVQNAPIEDIGYVILDSPQITFTHTVIQKLTDNNTAVVFCDDKHHPSAQLLPLDGHQLQNERFRHQVDASKPLKKQLWKQTIKAKIRNQARLLEYIDGNPQPLKRYARNVKSNDSSNEEAKAAKKYWKQLFGKKFKRHRFGEPPNHFLNYGYTILRSAVARALVSSGLLPTLGFHHHNRYNAYCLADDVMEPFRPFVDRIVWNIKEAGVDKAGKDWHVMTQTRKKQLINLLNHDIYIGNKTRPLMVGLSETSASLARCYLGEAKKVKYPQLPFQ